MVEGLVLPLGSPGQGAVEVIAVGGVLDLFSVNVTVTWDQKGRVVSDLLTTTIAAQ